MCGPTSRTSTTPRAGSRASARTARHGHSLRSYGSLATPSLAALRPHGPPNRPPVHGFGTNRPVERVRRLVPVEHREVDPAGRTAPQFREEVARDPLPPERGANEQVLEPDAVAAEPRRERTEVQRHARDRTVDLGDEHVRDRRVAEHVRCELVAIEHDGVGLALIGGELANEREHLVEVARNSVADHFLTNGGLTTVASRIWPRTSTCNASPSSTSGATNANAIAWPSVGEKLPLDTSPMSSLPRLTRDPSRAGRRPSKVRPRSRRVTPRA